MTPSILPVAASLVAIVCVILALGWLLRRMPGAGRASSALKIRAALAVGQRERVMWVEAGGKHLLIGVSPGSVRTLLEFKEPPVESSTSQPEVPTFASLLHRAWGSSPKP